MRKDELYLTIFTIIIGILLILGLWGTYCQFKNERIQNTQQKTEYQKKYPPSKGLGTQNCR